MKTNRESLFELSCMCSCVCVCVCVCASKRVHGLTSDQPGNGKSWPSCVLTTDVGPFAICQLSVGWPSNSSPTLTHCGTLRPAPTDPAFDPLLTVACPFNLLWPIYYICYIHTYFFGASRPI